MKLKNYRKKGYFFIFFTIFSFLILCVLNIKYCNDHINYSNNPRTSGIIGHLDEQWVVNPTFIAPGDPWYSSIEGDSSDLITSLSPNQANYVVIGESREKQIILNSTTFPSWTSFNKTKLSPNLGYGGDINGLYCGHDWDESAGPENTPSINWGLNVNMGVDMSDYRITSATFEAIIYASVNPDIDTPGDVIADWMNMSALNQAVFYDYAQFQIEISDLGLNEINTYRIAFDQTQLLGNDGASNYDMESLISTESEQAIINAINNILSIDSGHNNFVIVLSIYMYCEDNTFGMNYDRDQWEELRFKFLNFTLSYEKRINKFTSASWSQDLKQVKGSYVLITDANLSFKFKIDQNWPSSSQNSEIRIFINDRKHEEVINLSNYVYSPFFQEAKLGGFNITSKIIPYENFTLSIQLYLADNFGLESNITISITDVYLYISYTEGFPDISPSDYRNVIGPFILAVIFFIVSIVLALMLSHKPKWRGLEELSFTTGYPGVVKPDKTYSLSVYLHFPEFQDAVKKLIDSKEQQKDFDSYVPTLESVLELKCAITLKVIPQVEGIIFEPIKQEIAWYKDIKEFNFRINADPAKVEKSLSGSIDLFKDALLIGQIPLSIKVSQEEKPTEIVKTSSKMFESAFISYSYLDEELVDNFVEAYKSLGIDVNIATEKILTGEKWEKPLGKLMDKSDVFQLYWSTKAKESKNVTKEWKYALKLKDQKGKKFIRGCYWEIPMPELPEDLSKIHLHKINLRNLDLKRKIKKKLKKKPRKSSSSK